MKNILFPSLTLLILLVSVSCQKKGSTGNYPDILHYFKQHTSTIELSTDNGQSRLLITPEFQGRIVASSNSGENGSSQGWVNMPTLEEEQKATGGSTHGEERVWIGPQGSQFSFFYGFEKPIKESNWNVPATFNDEPFELVSQSETAVELENDIELTNNFGTTLHMQLSRNIELLERPDVENSLQVNIPKGIAVSAYETKHILSNSDSVKWDRETGLACIWSLSTFKGTDNGVSFIPVNEESQTNIRTYLSPINGERLVLNNHVVWYKNDGKYRNKLGIPPQLSKGIFGNYQPETRTLRIIDFQQEADTMYFNSEVSEQERPYRGEVIAIYNNGPMNLSVGKDNSFFELESTSPLKELQPGESVSHYHRVYQFTGEEYLLNQICKKVLGIDLNDRPF